MSAGVEVTFALRLSGHLDGVTDPRPGAIGYYAHHHGHGHLARAQALSGHLPNLTVLASVPAEPWVTDWVELPMDTGGDVGDPTAHGALHWAPRRHAGLRERMAAIAKWVEERQPAAVVVDVSVEVAVFLRLLGVPVVVVAMPGHREDPAHQLAYTVADRILAPWTEDVHPADHLRRHSDKVVHTGAISRFEGRPAGLSRRAGDRRRVLVLGGSGGTSLESQVVQRLSAELPTWELDVVGAGRWVADVWPHLCAADVVLAHAGQGAVADIATADRPAVLVPEDRPFDEQRVLAAYLAEAGMVTVRPSWDEVQAEDLEAAADRPTSWHRWGTSGAAARAAAAVLEVARR